MIRGTDSHKGRKRWLAPGESAVRHLHYGRIILDTGDAPVRFSNANHETGLICLTGGGTVSTCGSSFKMVPYDSLYIPRDSDIEVMPGLEGCDFAEVSAAVPQPDHGVTTVFITLPNTKIELLEPLGENSPIGKFLERNPDGGMHHICYEVDDIRAARDALKAAGARVLGDGEPRTGAHGKPVLFLHPKDFSGTLVELEQR